ncbi:hypothetical protein PF049_00210 [Erythrobacteraceae bacterium WH01K]|nr:hypothetical protein PF049_00210 [Erythrobacteraceae bacterium WH01K]
MAISAERAAFIKREYRYATEKNAALRGQHSNAQSITVDANVDEATASALASLIQSRSENGKMYEVEIQGLLTLDDFQGGMLKYIPQLADLNTDGRTCLLESFECDLETGVTTVRVFG